jgi:hypothetical protein
MLDSIRFIQVRSGQIIYGHDCLTQVSPEEVRAMKVSPAQVRPSKINPEEVRLGQVRPA